MPRQGPLAWLALALLAAILATVLVLVLQSDNLEQRLIQQSRELQALGEASDRLTGRLERLASSDVARAPAPAAGAAADAGRYAHVELLHPDAPNFLQDDDFRYPPPDASFDGSLVRGWPTGDPKGFNPLIENAAEVSELIEGYAASGVAARMIWTQPERWTGDLAWRVEITDDYQEYTIYLKEGVIWHPPPGVDLTDPRYAWLAGPHELTARDLAFTLQMILDPQVDNGALKNYYADIDRWQVVNDHVLVVRWKRKVYNSIAATLGLAPVPEFLYAYDERGARIPDETLGLRFNQHWYNNKGFVGTGPYRMSSYTPGTQIGLVRNEDYYGRRPAVRELVYPIYTDTNKTLLMLKSKELLVGLLRPAQYRGEILNWQQRPKAEWPADSPFLNGRIQCQKVSSPGFRYIGWNMDKPIFADQRVRRAMTHALNRQGIIDNVWVGLGVLLTGPIMPESPYSDPSIEPFAFDLARAKALLAEAGWEDTDADGLLDKDLDGDGHREPFEFTLVISNVPEYTSTANVFKDDLLKIGVKMNIESAEWSLMQKRMDERKFDAYVGGWALPWESDPYQLWHSSQADVPKGSNYVGFRNAEADEIIEKLRVTFDMDERVRLYRRFHQIIHDEQPYTFFMVPLDVFCWWNDVRNLVFAKTRPVTSSLPWWVQN
jgi:peptide/nickel transport system substrate-binding protein